MALPILYTLANHIIFAILVTYIAMHSLYITLDGIGPGRRAPVRNGLEPAQKTDRVAIALAVSRRELRDGTTPPLPGVTTELGGGPGGGGGGGGLLGQEPTGVGFGSRAAAAVLRLAAVSAGGAEGCSREGPGGRCAREYDDGLHLPYLILVAVKRHAKVYETFGQGGLLWGFGVLARKSLEAKAEGIIENDGTGEGHTVEVSLPNALPDVLICLEFDGQEGGGVCTRQNGHGRSLALVIDGTSGKVQPKRSLWTAVLCGDQQGMVGTAALGLAIVVGSEDERRRAPLVVSHRSTRRIL